MAHLTATELFEEYRNISEDFPLTSSELDRTIELYKRIEGEERHQTKNKKELKALYDEVVERIAAGMEKDSDIFTRLSDNSHMVYFDNFLAVGESEKVLQALKHFGIPTKALKGLAKDVPYDNEPLGYGISVTQNIVKETGVSPYIESFYIYYNGVKIYGYPDSVDYEIANNLIEEPEEVKKEHRQRFSGYKSSFITEDDGTVVVVKDKRNRIQYKDPKTGRFTSIK